MKYESDIIIKFKDYLKKNYIDENEANTIKAYVSDIKQFLSYFKDTFDEELISFSRVNITEFKDYMIRQLDYKPATINRKLASLSVYENFLIEENLKEEKSIRKKDFYKISTPYITSDMLPKKTMKKIKLEAGNENIRDYLIIVLISESGIRVSELINIQLDRDVNLEMRKILIWGKGRKIREVIITNEMLEAIEDYLPWREKKLNGNDNKYLIISNRTVKTGEKIDRTSVNKLLKKYCTKIKGKNVNPHLYRHLYATEKYESGYTDMVLKKALGQTSNITDRYVHPGGILNIKYSNEYDKLQEIKKSEKH